MRKNLISGFTLTMLLALQSFTINAQDDKLSISGSLLTNQRLRMQYGNDWIWNENRLNLNLDKRVSNNTRFYSEIWLRNLGLPDISKTAHLYNKGIVDPLQWEIRQAWVRFDDVLTPGLDLTFGRQPIAWGTADRFNPTNTLDAADLEDLLDFGRRRATDALSLRYQLGSDFSLQGVVSPFFRPANLPVGVLSNALNPEFSLPAGMVIRQLSDTLILPRKNLKESLTAGARFKGFVSSVDFSVSYALGYEGIPFNTRNSISAVDFTGGVAVRSEASFLRTHTIGADMSTSIAGIGFWAEGALSIAAEDVVLRTDLSAFSIPLQEQILIAKSKPWFKFVVGGDYHFADGSYLNLQYLHGFLHERGPKELNDYFFVRYDKKFFNEKLTVSPVSGAVVIPDWNNIGTVYSWMYMPEVTWKVVPDAEVGVSTLFIDGKGAGMFSQLRDFDMMMIKLRYNF